MLINAVRASETCGQIYYPNQYNNPEKYNFNPFYIILDITYVFLNRLILTVLIYHVFTDSLELKRKESRMISHIFTFKLMRLHAIA